MVHHRLDGFQRQRDLRPLPSIAGVEAGVVGDAEAGQRPQGVVVRAIVSGPERQRRGRARRHQQLLRQPQQYALVIIAEVADTGAAPPVHRINGHMGQPFGVDVQLHFVPGFQYGGHGALDDIKAENMPRHGVYEEHRLQAVSIQPPDLMLNAEGALPANTENGFAQVRLHAKTAHMAPHGQLRVNCDEDTRHRLSAERIQMVFDK